MRYFPARSLLLFPLLAFASGCEQPAVEPVASTVQQVRSGAGQEGDVHVGVDVLVTQGTQGIACGDATVTVDIEISRNGLEGPWVLVDSNDVRSTCASSGQGDLALVVDNSGSLVKDLAVLQDGARRVVDRITGDGGRVSLVRVSTEAQLKSELTADAGLLDPAIDELFVRNGWTALWDGVRLGNETLAFDRAPELELERHADAESFCSESRRRGIVLFTDGAENNSAHQRLRSEAYPGDGVDTALDDLLELRSGGMRTPIYAIGLGDQVETSALEGLATASGGRYLALDDPNGVSDMLDTVSSYFGAAHRVCTTVPSHLCGSLEVRVTQRFSAAGQSGESVSMHHLEVPCDARARGRVATVLLTMNATETPEATMLQLVANTVNWASPVDAPKVLFVLDDAHHGEFSDDTRQIHTKLVATGYDAVYLEEPKSGLGDRDVEGYDVIWFTNPGHPMDDERSFNTLRRFAESGGGVVLQGDDMSWSFGNDFPMTPLTRLAHVDNGTRHCGVTVDNGSGGRYRVTLNAETHPIVEGLEGVSFLYGDDIDTTRTLAEGTEVVAWATIEGKAGCERKPVVTAFTPQPE